ncbi:MAG: DUF6527 family protein [Amaricoccus sp.]|uniref:DUF6527 family protein n=1 Tax=Amaricoccus sp. TaxID=1872485 RepID=UPI00331632EE
MIVVRDPKDKWACFPCPCRCGEIVKLPLGHARRPRWSVAIDKLNRPTISPSIRQTSGCLSHYWIRRGRIEWCKDSGGREKEQRSTPTA